MIETKLGFIGAGNMAGAIIKGALYKNVINAGDIYVYDIDETKSQSIKNSLNVCACAGIDELCEKSDMLIIAVKPGAMEPVLKAIKRYDKPVVSIAAGWGAEKIKGILGVEKRVLRVMPNTPLMAGEGMSVFETPDSLAVREREIIERLFASLGKVAYAPAKLMDAVTAVSGSGPAYVYMFIEALADAGVLCGLPRDVALALSSQTVLGAAKMVIESGKHTGKLKDEVCSPAGTTIEAVKVLEQNGFRGAIISAVERCANKSKALSE